MSTLIEELNHALTNSNSNSKENCKAKPGENIGDVCTFCVTNTNLMYQGIYQCITCNKTKNKLKKTTVKNKTKKNTKNTSNQCFCLGCSKTCHVGHKVEFIAYGKAYCDCGCNGCQLLLETKSKYDLYSNKINNTYNDFKYILKSNRYPFGIHQISPIYNYNLKNPNIAGCKDDYLYDMLRKECMAIVTQSKETFWIGSDWKHSNDTDTSCGNEDRKCRCMLEDLALMIFEYHTEKLGENREGDHSIGKSDTNVTNTGLEWWIQIKNLNDEAPGPSIAKNIENVDHIEKNNDIHSPVIGAIDGPTIELHYDKDEVMADLWGIGKFPDLGTVTYLSTSTPHYTSVNGKRIPAQPTAIYSNTTGDDVGNPIRDCYISYPRVGKHVCFDGNLLHGAFSDTKLAHWEQTQHQKQELESTNHTVLEEEIGLFDGYRFTFLVNIWLDHHPEGIEALPGELLEKIKQVRGADGIDGMDTVMDMFDIKGEHENSVFRLDVDTNDALDYDRQGVGEDEEGVEVVEFGNTVECGEEEDEAENIEQYLKPGYHVVYAPFIPAPVEDTTDAGEEEESGLILRMILPPPPSSLPSIHSTNSTSGNINIDCSSYHIHYMDDDCAAVLQHI